MSTEENIEHEEIEALENLAQSIEESDNEDTIVKKEEIEIEEFNTKIEILVELDQNELRPFTLSDCYATDKAGMQLEILPKIIFETVEEDLEEDAIDLPKPIYRLTVDYGTQATVKYQSSEAQTNRRRLVNSWCQYEPRLFSEEEKEDNILEESFSSFAGSAEERVLNALMQNEIADIFTWDLCSLYEDNVIKEETETSLKISGCFTSPQSMGRKMISSIDWHLTYRDIFVASSINLTSFEERTKKLIQDPTYSVQFYVWSSKNQFSHQLILGCSDDITILSFNPTIPNLIVGGTLSGQLMLWDIKNKLSPNDNSENNFYNRGFASTEVIPSCASSNMDHLQVFGITHLLWVPPSFEVGSKGVISDNSANTSFQIMASSLDGVLSFWDLRPGYPFKLNIGPLKKFTHLNEMWEPFHTMELVTKSKKSLTRFCFRETKLKELVKEEVIEDESEFSEKEPVVFEEVDDQRAEFYGGCDDGSILCGNIKLDKDEDGKYFAKKPVFYQSPHGGSITVLSSSPFVKDTFMTAADKTVAIWKHDIKSRPFFLRERASYVTSGKWSPTRAAVFILGFKSGSIEVWDLLQDIYEPTIVFFLSTSSVKCLSIQKITELEHVVAIGDSSGVVYTITLPSTLWLPVEDELIKVNDFIQKETNRMNEQTESRDEIQDEKDMSLSGNLSRKRELQTDDMEDKYKAFLEFEKAQMRRLNFPGEEEEEIVEDKDETSKEGEINKD